MMIFILAFLFIVGFFYYSFVRFDFAGFYYRVKKLNLFGRIQNYLF